MSKQKTIGAKKTCANCKTVYKGEKPPPGWKTLIRHNVQMLCCAKCKKELTVCRAAEFPVLSPMAVIDGNTTRPMDWKEFNSRVSAMLKNARILANWGASVLFAHDSPPDPTGKNKLEKYSKNLYNHIKLKNPIEPAYPHRDAWVGCMGSAGEIVRNVESAYKKQRYDILCSGKRSLQSFRSMPFPIRDDAIRVELVDLGPTVVSYQSNESPEKYAQRVSRYKNEILLVTIPLPKVTLMEEVSPKKKKKDTEQKKEYKEKTYPPCNAQIILDIQKGFDRQHNMICQVLRGDATLGSAAIYRKKSSTGIHRNKVMERGNSQQIPMRTFIKLVGWFPRKQADSTLRDEIMTVYTDPNSFWVAEINGKEVWVENADHMRRRIIHSKHRPKTKINTIVDQIEKHVVYLDRIKQDAKYERRSNRRQARLDMINDNMDARSKKMRNRLNTFIDQSVSALVGIAERRNVGHVVYTDVCRSYVSSFPWAIFRERLKERLPPGVIFQHVNADDEEKENEIDKEMSAIIS